MLYMGSGFSWYGEIAFKVFSAGRGGLSDSLMSSRGVGMSTPFAPSPRSMVL